MVHYPRPGRVIKSPSRKHRLPHAVADTEPQSPSFQFPRGERLFCWLSCPPGFDRYFPTMDSRLEREARAAGDLLNVRQRSNAVELVPVSSNRVSSGQPPRRAGGHLAAATRARSGAAAACRRRGRSTHRSAALGRAPAASAPPGVRAHRMAAPSLPLCSAPPTSVHLLPVLVSTLIET